MKNVILVLAMILFSSCVTSKFTTRELESSTNQELFLSRFHPRFHPKPHWPFRGPRIAFPPIPAGHFRLTLFHLPQEVTRCLSNKKEVSTCFDDISRAFNIKKAAIGSDCCDVIKKMTKNCEQTVFGSFHNPILTGYVKLHCSTVVGSTSYVPSLAPSSALLLAPSLSFLLAPLLAPSPAPSLVPSSPAPSPALSLAPLLVPSPAPSLALSPSPSLASPPALSLAPSPAPSLVPSSAPSLALLLAPSPAQRF